MNTMKANKFALLCACSVLALTSAANAQQQADNTETVTVTGSRVITEIANSPTPLTVITADQLQTTTPSDIPDALQKLPNVSGSTPRSQGNGATNNGGNTLGLRSLGAQRTLILLDGQRVASSNQNGTVDTDTLPQMLMTRVDVVAGGASAVYGSDAVGGVINFVLNKNFTGVKYEVNAGISGYGDAAQEKFGLAWGTELFGGRGHYEGSLRLFNQDMIPIAARPYGYANNSWVQAGRGTAAAPFVDVPFGRLFNQSLTGTINCGSTCSLTNYTFNPQGGLIPLVHGIPTTTAGLEQGGGGGYANPLDTTMQSRQRQGEFFSRFSYNITSDLNFFVQASASEAYDFSRWTPIVVSSGTSRPNTFFTNNAFLTPDEQAALTAAATAAKHFMPAPVPYTQLVGNITSIAPAVAANTPYFSDARYVNIVDGQHLYEAHNVYETRGLDRNLGVYTGLTGKLSSFDWEAAFSHQESRVYVDDPQNTNNQRYMAAQDAVIAPAGTKVNGVDIGGTITCWDLTQPAYASLFPGCVPMNLFSPTGPSQESFDYIKGNTYWALTQKLDNINGSISGGLFGLGLPAGEITTALSAEMRWRTYDMKSNALPTDFVNCTGLRMCTVNGGAAPALWTQNVNAPISVSDNVWEAALEFNVPLLKDMPLAQELSTDIAGRYTDYSVSGVAETWKIGLNYRINDTVRLRGTMSFDIRAPNLNDLYQPLGISSTGFTDLLTTGNQSTQLVTQGNASLTPEEAHTWMAGIVLTPDFIPGLTASLDYFQTHLSNAISGLAYTNTTVQRLCIASAPSYDSPYCLLAVRPIAPGQPGYASLQNYPTQIKSSPLNSGQTLTEGWDFETNYNFSLDDLWSGTPGEVSLRHIMTYQPVFETQLLPGTAFTFGGGSKTRMTTFLNYQVADWGFSVQNVWLSGRKKTADPTIFYAVPRLHSMDTTDLTIDRKMDLWGGHSDIYLNIQNVANTRAQMQGANASVPGLFYPGSGSDVGRYFTLGIRGNL